MVFIDRSRRADRYPWLVWKVRAFVAGAALSAVGMATESDPLIIGGIVALAIGFLFRFLPGGRGERLEGDPVDDEEEGSSG